MKIKLFLLSLIWLALASFSAYSQSDDAIPTNPQVNNAFGNKKEVYFKFNVASRAEIDELTKIISIDNVKNNEVWAYANKKEFAAFLLKNYNYTILPNPGIVTWPQMNPGANLKQIQTWNYFPTYSQYVTLMTGFVAAHPTICRLDTIGTLSSGHMLLAIVISDNVNVDENEPEFLYTSSIHGDETTGYIMMLHLIDYLLSNYSLIPKVTSLVDNIEIYICPLANPDGTYAGGDNTVSGATRENGNTIDLNRNYPDPVQGQHPDGNAWQEETQFFRAYADAHDFVMSANFHGGSEVANYPWDSKAGLTADDSWWQRVSHGYADTAQTFGPSGYFTSVNANGITDGYAWYSVYGGRQDYMNYFKHCREETIEISNTKNPAASTLLGFWDDNYRSMLNYMQESLYGIRGKVTDSCTNAAIKAKVFITGHDVDSSHVYSSLPVGNYHRPIIAGTYNLTFSASGYQTKTINGIIATNGTYILQNVKLIPILPTADFIADVTTTCEGVVNFTNLSSSSASQLLWNFGDGTTSGVANPTHQYTTNGTYTVTLTATNCAGNDVMTKTSYIVVNMPTSPTVTDGSRCGAGSVNLSASGSGTLNWYDAPISGNLVNTGISFTTPVLTNTTTYYVQNSVPGTSTNVGKLDNTGTGSYTTGTTNYLIFDCYSPVTLVSAVVYPGGAGTRTFELRDNTGTVLQSSTQTLTATSPQTITLNFPIPVGSNLQLGITGSTINMWRNTAGITYPYTATGLLSITGASTAGRYYYFYNWLIQQPSCSSPSIPVLASIINIPIANFTYSAVGLTVNFTNLSTNATSWGWAFGDGATSTLQNPSHTYASAGTYNVHAAAYNSCGGDTTMIPVTVVPVGIAQSNSYADNIDIYPNPSDGNMVMLVSSEKNQICSLKVMNLIGQEIYTQKYNATTGVNNFSVDLSNKTNGIYFIKVLMNNKTFTRKIVIQ